MKKFTMVLLAIAITACGFAQSSSLDIATVKKIYTNQNVTSLKVFNNVEVILTHDSLTTIQVAGEKSTVEKTSVKLSKGELTIVGGINDINENVIVYVPAKYVDKVYIHGSSNVVSEGLLNNQSLDVIINGEGKCSISTTGLISINTVGDFPLDPSSL